MQLLRESKPHCTFGEGIPYASCLTPIHDQAGHGMQLGESNSLKMGLLHER